MVKVTRQQAKEFLNKINPEDKIMIFTHSDLDGFSAGSLLKEHCNSKGAKIEVNIIDYGLSKISDFDLSDFNKVLISDLAPGTVSKDLQNLKDKEVFYTDHHPSIAEAPTPEFVLELRTTEEGYFPSSRTVYELVGGRRWLAVLGVVSDAGEKYPENKKFIDSFLAEEGISFDDFLFKIVFNLNNALIFLDKDKKKAFELIDNLKELREVGSLSEFWVPVQEEISKLIKEFEENQENFGKVVWFYFEPKYHIKSFLINRLSTKKPEKVFVFAVPKNDELISMSGRNQGRGYDLTILFKDCLEDLKSSFSGGHKVAVGAHVLKEDLDTFKERLKNYDLEKAKVKNEK